MCIRDRRRVHGRHKTFSHQSVRMLRSAAFRLARRTSLLHSQKSFAKFAKDPKQQIKTPIPAPKEETTPTFSQEMRKSIEKLEEEMVLTEADLKLLNKERIDHVAEVIKEKKIPRGALLAGVLATAPVLFGAVGINALCMYDLFPEYIPSLFNLLVKYSGMHITMFAGMHWGYALVQHDVQTDTVDSSREIRKYFLLAAVPVFLSFLGTVGLCYAFSSTTSLSKLYYLFLLICLHLSQRSLPHED
eukprot:TRINITY_DN5763_c0_g1_i2.p1 TRINITY_DN5763_c0_g1~~TRINITY_DN5763_c0_g1_i2.p1  ORF type:complete len:245 (-),score=49.18 TRINITY_DN5763_c0_g1_i2:722-1456(-)